MPGIKPTTLDHPALPVQPALCSSGKAFGLAKLINTVGSLFAFSALLHSHHATGRGTLPRGHLVTFLTAFQWLIIALRVDSKHRSAISKMQLYLSPSSNLLGEECAHFHCFETGFHCVGQAGLELTVLLLSPPGCQAYSTPPGCRTIINKGLYFPCLTTVMCSPFALTSCVVS